MLCMCVDGMEMDNWVLDISPMLIYLFQFLDCSNKLLRLLVAGIILWPLPVCVIIDNVCIIYLNVTLQ